MKFLNYILFLIILIVIFGCSYIFKDKTEFLENTQSGDLEIISIPDDADVILDGNMRGKTPLKLVSLKIGSHDLVISKEGYEEFNKAINIQAGITTKVEANLIEIEVEPEGPAKEGKVKIIDKLLQYYDFDKNDFNDYREPEDDIFSRKYPDFLEFNKYSPVQIKVINKKIEDVNKEDCEDIIGSHGFLYSEQSLCVITKEELIVAIGGKWVRTTGENLTWKIME